MNPDLEKLIDLQHAETEIARLEAELVDIPRLRQEIQARLDRDRGRLDAARAALEESQKTRKQNETAVQDLEGKRSKYKGQLMEVKTNKEYTAMLHEIENVEREITTREDQILEEMEKAESLTADVKREEEAFRGVEADAKKETAELDAREKRLEEQRRRVADERDRVVGTIPEGPLKLFQRVAGLRGTGVGEARDGVCQACHVTLRPQLWVEMKKNEEILQCGACNRILYYEPPAEVVEP